MSIYDRGKARRSLFDTVSYRALSQVATVLGYIVLVRGMNKVDFGIFNLLYAFIPVVSMLASLGLEQTLRRYQPEYLHDGNASAAAWLSKFVASARFGTNVVILGGLLLIWNHVAPTFGLTAYRAQFALFSVLILVHFQTQVVQLSLASHMLHRYSVGSMALLSFGKLVAYALFAWFGTLSLQKAIISDLLAYALAYTFMRAMYRKHCLQTAQLERYRPDASERKRLVRYGLYNNFNEVGTLVLGSQSDNFFIAAFIDSVSVGIYAFYTRLNDMAGNVLPGRLFENVIQPMFFAIKRTEANQRIPQYFTFLVNMNLILQWPILAYAIVYHAEIVQVIFGGKFIEYSWLLPITIAFTTINVVGTPATLVAQYEEKARIILLSKISAIYNIAAMLILLPTVGLFGAALATGSAQVAKNLFIWWHVRHRAVWANFRSVIFTSLALWGGTVATCDALKSLLHVPAPIQMSFGVIICGASSLIYFRSAAISANDRTILASLFQGKEARILTRLGLLTH
jgi:O-antigen/teichoic acid export membrane protein